LNLIRFSIITTLTYLMQVLESPSIVCSCLSCSYEIICSDIDANRYHNWTGKYCIHLVDNSITLFATIVIVCLLVSLVEVSCIFLLGLVHTQAETQRPQVFIFINRLALSVLFW